jgi:CubicO group peptidase (beta-lactamase class C family)
MGIKKELNEAITLAGKVVDSWLPMKIKYDQTPGAVVCIAVNGKPKYTKAFGLADLESQTPIKIDAQFRVASMSKMFTAVAIMQLQEDGKLRIDDKVSEHLIWFKGKSGKTDLGNVTIRQLLSHSSGLFRDGTAKQWVKDNFPKKIEGTITAKSITFENATTFKYSNHGYAVLGALIEKLSGLTYVDYQVKKIITPLGLKNTFPDLQNEKPKKLIVGYTRWTPDSKGQTKEPAIKTYAYAPATGFISNVYDLASFLSSLHFDSKKGVLSRESKKEMMRVHGIPDENEMYGLGLSLDTVSGQLTYGHSGGFAGYTTNAIAEPSEDLQVIVLTNTISSTAWRVSNSIMRLIFKLLNMKNTKTVVFEPYSGTYRSRWGDTSVVSLGENLVKFSAGADNPADAWTILEKEKKLHVYRDTKKKGFDSPGEPIKFTKIENGKAQVMVADGIILERIQ